ncbi:Hypothetical predicted protein [Paramuricea clavata]|uniref:Uncharacterized protein n=1 Tax=Paramuricea clavata TaxID=317549 RepID=A0A7D9J066_PARCT|nr:Hypothetical predicted protein [Paramuricea clavata]
MATSSSPIVQPMAPFDPDTEIGTNLAPKWKIWIDDFKTYLVATGITDKKRQRALLLYQVGSRVREIFRQLPDTAEDNDLDTAIIGDEQLLSGRHRTKRSEQAEVHVLHKNTRQPQSRNTSLCRNCGGEWPHENGNCPARGKECRRCAAFKQLGPIKLTKTRIKAYPFNATEPARMKAKFQTTIESWKKITVATIYVTEADGGCLLSANTAEELGLMTLHLNQVTTTKPTSKGAQKTLIGDKRIQRIVDNYSSVLQGQGKLQDKQIELIIDKTIKF